MFVLDSLYLDTVIASILQKRKEWKAVVPMVPLSLVLKLNCKQSEVPLHPIPLSVSCIWVYLIIITFDLAYQLEFNALADCKSQTRLTL